MSESIFYLNISCDNQGRALKIILEEKRSKKEMALQQYFKADICPETIKSLCQEIYTLLLHSTHSLENSIKGNGRSLLKISQHLYDSIFPVQVKEKLAAINVQNLSLIIDDSLVGIPWEVLYDGEEFLCLHFNMGRRVHTSHPIFEPENRNDDHRIKMLILADPRSDLPSSYDEGSKLSKQLEQCGDTLDVFLETSHIDSKKIFRHIFEYDIIHYAGHAVYNQKNPELSGWHLMDGYLTAQQILQMPGGKKRFPSLIFSNACQSGKTGVWPQINSNEWIDSSAFDLVNAFLRCGVRHYIGTFQDIRDKTSLDLALYFYRSMMHSHSIGKSLRLARLQMLEEYGRDSLIWANYMLYGDPTISYLKPSKGKTGQDSFEHKKGKAYDRIIGKADSDEEKYESKDSHEDLTPKYAIKRTGDHLKKVKSPEAVSRKKRDDSKNEAKRARGKKLKRTMIISLGGGFLIFCLIVAIRLFMPHPDNPSLSNNSYDPKWEREKWQIVREIQEKLNQRYSGKETAPGVSPDSIQSDQSSEENLLFTMCIVPAVPQGRARGIDRQLTALMIEELHLFLVEQPGFILVERDRLDFVLEELERSTSGLSEGKIRFTLGKVLGAKGILFVSIFPKPTSLPIPFYAQEMRAFVRFVNTETTAIEAYAKTAFKKNESLEQVGRSLGEKILSSLKREWL